MSNVVSDLRGLAADAPRHHADTLTAIADRVQCGLPIPRHLQDGYHQYLASSQRQSKFGK